MLTDAQVVGATGGEASHQLNIAELAAHTHGVCDTLYGGNNGVNSGTMANPGTTYSGGSTGSNVAHNNIQPSIVCNFIIKT